MRNISTREVKGHDIWAVERFHDNIHWMIEFLNRQTGDEMRLFLTNEDYAKALEHHKRHEIKIKRYARVVEGHILDFKPKKHRRN